MTTKYVRWTEMGQNCEAIPCQAPVWLVIGAEKSVDRARGADVVHLDNEDLLMSFVAVHWAALVDEAEAGAETSVFDDIRHWQRTQFPAAALDGAAFHLADEAQEAVQEIMEGQSNDRMAEELADVVFMAIQCFTLLGVDMEQALRAKLKKNKAREWPRVADGRGVYHHVEIDNE